MDIATKIKFEVICTLLENIQKSEEVRQKEKHLNRYIESFKKFKENFCKSQEKVNDTSFYCVLRCLIPNSDTARPKCGIQIHSLGKIYIKILNLSLTSDDAQVLTFQKNIDSGDYADRIYRIMRLRGNTEFSQLTLADVHSILDKLAQEDRRSAEKEFTAFIETASAMEQKWFIRIMLKKTNIGIGEQKIFSVYHPLAKEFYLRYTNLKKVCESVESGEVIDINEAVTPFQYIRPMLCKHSKITDLPNLFEIDTLYTETKMDGERFQLHMSNETYKYISRNGKDYSKFFGHNVSEGNLTPFISGLLSLNVKSIILDGEMMVYDRLSGSYRVKGENFDVKHLQIGGNLRPCFVVYDLLHLNGVSYLDSPYIERSLKMAKYLTESKGILQICKHTKLTTIDYFKDAFNEAINNNEEGIVVKQQRSLYKPGKRNGGWFKFKPDYIEGLISDFDLLIIGGFYNNSKKYIESYLVGVLKQANIENETPVFYSVGKVSQGCTVPERKELNVTLGKYWRKSSICGIEAGASEPDVWIEPTDSIILQIRASELAPSSSFRTPYALRFPRIEAIRNDKVWNECMTLEEFQNYYKGETGVKKITKRELNSNDFSIPKQVKIEKSIKINPYATNLEVEEASRYKHQVFDGKNFCILSGSKEHDLDDIRKMVLKFGGKIVLNPLMNSQCINIAGDITKKVQLLIGKSYYNIISLNWLLNSMNLAQSGEKLFINPRDMICSTPEMKEHFIKSFDKYGDSFSHHLNIDELKLILNEMQPDIAPIKETEMIQLENEIYGNKQSPNYFRNINGFFFVSSSNGISLDMKIAKMRFEFHGGRCYHLITSDNKEKINFIFVDSSNRFNHVTKQEIVDIIHKSNMNTSETQIVAIDWITVSHFSSSRIPISKYVVSLC